MERITQKHLEALVARINTALNRPQTPYTKNADGTFTANLGNFHLDYAYGGVQLEEMLNDGGGVRTVLNCGHVSKRALYELMHAFLRGLEAKSA